MALEYSTALKDRLLGGGTGDDDIASIFANSYIVIYAGTPPSVDSASVGTVLAVIATKGETPGAGNGLDLGAAGGGAISKDADEWGVAGDFNGGDGVDNPGALTARYFRWIVDNGYTASSEVIDGAATDGATNLRIQGTCGATAAADLVLSAAAPLDETPLDIASFTVFF